MRFHGPVPNSPNFSTAEKMPGRGRKPSHGLFIRSLAMVSFAWMIITTTIRRIRDSQAVLKAAPVEKPLHLFSYGKWPKKIHATNFDRKKFGGAELECIESCMLRNPDHDFFFYSDEDIRAYVSEYFPMFLKMFDGLENNVMRTDVWRYLILYREGGAYFDTDVTCVKPINDWPAQFGSAKSNLTAIIGVEIAIEEQKFLQFTQWAMYAQPGHRIFLRTVEIIQDILDYRKKYNVTEGDAVQITGPQPFTRAIEEEMRMHNVTSKDFFRGEKLVMGDIGVLNVNGFAPLQVHSNATMDRNHPDILIIHGFFGR